MELSNVLLINNIAVSTMKLVLTNPPTGILQTTPQTGLHLLDLQDKRIVCDSSVVNLFIENCSNTKIFIPGSIYSKVEVLRSEDCTVVTTGSVYLATFDFVSGFSLLHNFGYMSRQNVDSYITSSIDITINQTKLTDMMFGSSGYTLQ